MARKKVTTTVEEVIPEVDYKEVHEAKIEDLVGEPEKKVEEEIKEPPVEEKKEVEVEFDPAKWKEEITEETAKKIIEAQTKQPEPVKEEDKELMSPWAKENRTPKDYEEVADWGVEKAKILGKRDADAQVKVQEEQTKKQEEYNKQQVEQFNKYTDEQLEDLMTQGKIPRNDEEARKALFQTMLEVNQERVKENKSPIYSIKEIFYEHYKPVNTQPAGADAPISAGKGNVSPEGQELDYQRDVKNKSLMDILMGK